MRAFVVYLFYVAALAVLVPTATGACRLGCSRIYFPVCGYRELPGAAPEHRNFGNRCQFDQANCLHPDKAYQQIGEDGDACNGGD